MPVPVPSAASAGQGDDPELGSEALAARVAVGPGLWDDEDWLAELRRDGLIGELLAAGTIGQAAAEGGHAHSCGLGPAAAGAGQDGEADEPGDGVAFLHLKKTVRGAGRALRGRSAALARQEAWALLLVHNMIAALAAEAAVTAGPASPPSPSPPCCPWPASTSPPTPAAATAGSARPAAATRAPGSPPPSPPSR